MKKHGMIKVVVFTIGFSLIGIGVVALDYPHNDSNTMGCGSCHYTHTEPLPPTDMLCISCHNGIVAPYVQTHSSAVVGAKYGTWAVECRTCHDPHKQRQFWDYQSEPYYLYQGTSTTITATTITQTGAGWAPDEYQGFIVVPNTAQKSYNYKIIGNTDDTLTVGSPMNLSKVTVGDTFAIIYGKLVESTVSTPNSGDKTVKLFRSIGTESFADGNVTYDGVCEVCHTQTTHFKNDGLGIDQLHTNVGGAAGEDCINCHPHENGFGHGGSSGCIPCHGHDAGTLYDPDASAPYTSGATASQGNGTTQSHSTHTETDSDDVKGPGIYCDTCHDINDFPYFISGTDSNGDGKYNLAETDVCDTCHSPGGTYDGIDDPVIGAKSNWDNGVYTGANLIAGKEKWCAGCHDESASVIQSVNAPNIAGDEDADTNYGIGAGYGFYKTGHGLPTNQTYPASGGTVSGAGTSCGYCHDFTMKHIDGAARTYVYTATVGDDNDYQHGYRLRSINGELPLVLPRTGTCADSGVNPTEFRLCFSCHDSGTFTDSSNYATNFRHTATPDFNAHNYHLSIKFACGPGPNFSSDWSFSTWDSRTSCVTCHNVHGSEQLAMVRDGKLVNSEPGLEVAYYNSGVSFNCFTYPNPADVSLPESTGTIWRPTVSGLCDTCHGGCGFDSVYYRSNPPQIIQVQGQVGSNTLTVEFSVGVYSDPGATGDLGVGDFTLTDLDNSRTITGVTHTAGQSVATLTLSSVLDATDDIGTDTLAAATSASIYNAASIPMDTTPVTITGLPGADSDPPVISNQTPANGVTGVNTYSNLTFTLSDSGSGVDWSTFEIQLTGDQGYSELYTDMDFLIVSKTGNTSSYDVTVNPDIDFGAMEVITVTINVVDYAGNPLVPPAWSFMTGAAAVPQMITLHPSGLASSTGSWSTVGGGWADILDSNDGTTTYAVSGTGGSFDTFYVDLDDSGLAGVTIQSLTFHVYARFIDGSSPTLPACSGSLDIGYKTGTATIWDGVVSGDGTFSLVSSSTYTTDSDGGAIELTDINNLQIAAMRSVTGNCRLAVTEVYAEVTYLP